MGQEPVTVSTRRIYDGRVVKLDLDTMAAPGGEQFELEIVRHPGAAAVVALVSPVDADDPVVLLIRQFRHAAHGVIWEVPAGVLEPGESPEACARRELREETGAVAGQLEHLTTIFTTPGFTDEVIHLFLATELAPGAPAVEQDEFIETATRPLSEVLEMVRDGAIRDAKSIAALLYAAGFVLGL